VSVLAASVCAQTAPELSKKITELAAIDLDDLIDIAFLKLLGYFAREQPRMAAARITVGISTDAGQESILDIFYRI
jgi:hypothetical protein